MDVFVFKASKKKRRNIEKAREREKVVRKKMRKKCEAAVREHTRKEVAAGRMRPK